ncbi:hypothetical protein MUG91_G63n54 [Manis pentadactyla]|nr:hypothetical protein MUG91_G63n54 [Manis pentadactyla]
MRRGDSTAPSFLKACQELAEAGMDSMDRSPGQGLLAAHGGRITTSSFRASRLVPLPLRAGGPILPTEASTGWNTVLSLAWRTSTQMIRTCGDGRADCA